MAASETNLQTTSGMVGSRAEGKIFDGVSKLSGIRLAIALAAAIFISLLITLALTFMAPLKIPGKASELLT